MSCRICLQKADIINKRFLIDPCDCKGSQRYVHKDCLKIWVQTSQNYETCPTCNAPYSVRFKMTNDAIDLKIIKVIVFVLLRFLIGNMMLIDMLLCSSIMLLFVEIISFIFNKEHIY